MSNLSWIHDSLNQAACTCQVLDADDIVLDAFHMLL